MLTVTFNDITEQKLNLLTRMTHKTIEQIIDDSLALYAEQQEDNECLAIIDERQNESLVNYEDVLTRLKADGYI